jgi:hypothetical protein
MNKNYILIAAIVAAGITAITLKSRPKLGICSYAMQDGVVK